MPTYGAFAANAIQFVPESTAGTYLAPTNIWVGSFADIDDQRTIAVPGRDHQTGLIQPVLNSVTTQERAALTIPETDLTFEQGIHPFLGGVKLVTAVDEGAGSGPYRWTFNYPTGASVNSVKTYTFLTGNAQINKDVRAMSHGFCESISLSGAQGETWKIGSNWVGNTVATKAAMISLSQPTVQFIPFSQTAVYIDDSGGTIGTTQVSDALLSANISINTGMQPVFVGDGVLYYTQIKQLRPSITLTLTFELENTSIVQNERADYVAENLRLIRLENTPDANHEFIMDFSALYTGFGSYSDDNGNTTVQVEAECFYSPTDSLYFEAQFLNTISALS